jgi:hypothetical protein
MEKMANMTRIKISYLVKAPLYNANTSSYIVTYKNTHHTIQVSIAANIGSYPSQSLAFHYGDISSSDEHQKLK